MIHLNECLGQPDVMGLKMGILRFAVLGAAVFMLLPTPPAEKGASEVAPVAALETQDLLAVAFGTFTDLATFCARQPQTCEAMASVALVAEAKAKYSLKLAYEWANGRENATESVPATGAAQAPSGIGGLLQPSATQDENSGSSVIMKQSAADPMVTGSTTVLAFNDEGNNTLRIDDLSPDWRGPAEPASDS